MASQDPTRCAAPLYGDPLEPRRCPYPGKLRIPCPVEGCEVAAWACGVAHRGRVGEHLRGHVLNRHPETMPDEIEAIRRDPRRLAELHAMARKLPGQFDRLLAALVSRHRGEFDELMQDQEKITPIEVVKAASRRSDKRRPGEN